LKNETEIKKNHPSCKKKSIGRKKKFMGPGEGGTRKRSMFGDPGGESSEGNRTEWSVGG